MPAESLAKAGAPAPMVARHCDALPFVAHSGVIHDRMWTESISSLSND